MELFHPIRNPLPAWRNIGRAVVAIFLAVALTGCVTARFDAPRTRSEAWMQPGETLLGRAFTDQFPAQDGQSGFHLLTSGMEAFSMRAALSESAQRTLDLQYYIVREDVTADLLLHRVLLAANRGVRVRLLIDDVYAAGNDLRLATFSSHPEIEVRVFNPFTRRGALGVSQLFEFLGDSMRLNHRMHNKLWIADNAAAIVGGRNVGDEYFDAHSGFNFADLDVLVAGPVVRDISRGFDEYWNSEWAVPVEAFVAIQPGPERLAALERHLEARLEAFHDTEYARTLRETGPALRLRSGSLPLVAAQAIALYDTPAKVSDKGDGSADPVFSSSVRPLIEAAQREVILISPYFIPSERGVGILTALVGRGVRVRILTNSLASTDTPLAHAGYARYRARLLAAGVELYEMRPDQPRDAVSGRHAGASSSASLHAKAVVVDRRHALLGSMNLDPRSRLHNTEVALLLQSEQIGARLGTFFDEATQPAHVFRLAAVSRQDTLQIVWVTEEGSRQIRYYREPLAGPWRRLLSKVLGALAPEDLL